jgi:hypothetical protein
VLIGLSGVIALFLIGTGIYVATYDPICPGPCTGISGVHGTNVTDLGSYTSPRGESFEAYRAELRTGQVFSFWVMLENDGPFGVTIVHIGDESRPFEVLSVLRTEIAPEMADVPLQPFQPFSLAPHESYRVLVTMRLLRCLDEGTSMTVASVPVTYRVLGITHHTTVHTNTSVEVVGQRGVDCSTVG